jgi:hypothetical protein
MHVKNKLCKSLGHLKNIVCGGMMVCSLPQFQNKWLSLASGKLHIITFMMTDFLVIVMGPKSH